MSNAGSRQFTTLPQGENSTTKSANGRRIFRSDKNALIDRLKLIAFFRRRVLMTAVRHFPGEKKKLSCRCHDNRAG